MKTAVTTAAVLRIAVLVQWMLVLSGLGAADVPLDELRSARKKALERPRRVIFNNDGNEPVYTLPELSAAALLNLRTSPLAGSAVDSIFYCTWSSGFGLFTHDTRVGQVFSSREGLFAANRAPELIAAGLDPLHVMTGFARRQGMEIFWSFRMNDTHDGSKTEYGPIMLRANRLKTEHPDWMIGAETQKPKFGAWTAVDYSRAEIRDLAFRFTEEVCTRYDVDGVELDFFRHPVFFKRAAMSGTACTEQECEWMSDLLRRIRMMTEAVGMRRGKPLLIAVRVPDSAAYAKACGLDVERWLEEGLVDLLIASGYFQLSRWETTAALGHRHGAKVYPSLDETRVRDEKARSLRSTTAAYRGRSAAALAAGVDGIYLFNSFNPNNPIWRELGSKETLAPLDKDYFASIRGLGGVAGGALPHGGFVRVPTLNPGKPIPLVPNQAVSCTFEAGLESERPAEVRLLLQFGHRTGPSKPPSGLVATFNGHSLEAGCPMEDGWIWFKAEQAWLHSGKNDVVVSLSDSTSQPLQWNDLRCTVRYR